jgi:hypothetical protein
VGIDTYIISVSEFFLPHECLSRTIALTHYASDLCLNMRETVEAGSP